MTESAGVSRRFFLWIGWIAWSFSFDIGATAITVPVAAPRLAAPLASFLAYTEQGKDDHENQDDGDCGNNWIVPRHEAEEWSSLAALCICGFFGGVVAEGIPSHGDKSTDEQNNPHNIFFPPLVSG